MAQINAIEPLALAGYKAYVSHLKPGINAPSCYNPMAWEQLHPAIREAYLATKDALALPAEHVQGTLYAYNGYAAVMKISGKGVQSWNELPPAFKEAWYLFKQAVLAQHKALAN
jgi:hypothetical protein